MLCCGPPPRLIWATPRLPLPPLLLVLVLLLLLLLLLPQEIDYYVSNYPLDGEKVLGFLDYQLLLGLQLDHIYTAWYFYGSIALLAASLMACTYTTQLPTAKVCGRWRGVGRVAVGARVFPRLQLHLDQVNLRCNSIKHCPSGS